MSVVRDLLLSLDWSSIRAAVFLELFENGPKRVNDIVDRLGSSKKIIVDELEGLVKIGLVSQFLENNESYFRALEGEKITLYYGECFTKSEARFDRAKQVQQELQNLAALNGRFKVSTEGDLDKLGKIIKTKVQSVQEKIILFESLSTGSDWGEFLRGIQSWLSDIEREFSLIKIPHELSTELGEGGLILGNELMFCENGRVVTIRSSQLANLIRWLTRR